MNIETSFLEWWYWKDIWRLELLNKIQFTPWKNEPIFEKLLICHIFCLFFFEQHKKYNGKNGREKRGKHSRVLSRRVIFQKRSFFRENAWGILNIFKKRCKSLKRVAISLQDKCLYTRMSIIFEIWRIFQQMLTTILVTSKRNFYLNKQKSVSPYFKKWFSRKNTKIFINSRFHFFKKKLSYSLKLPINSH